MKKEAKGRRKGSKHKHLLHSSASSANSVLPGRNYQFSMSGQVLGRAGAPHQGRESFPCSSSQGFYHLTSAVFGCCSFRLFGGPLMKNKMKGFGHILEGLLVASAISSSHLILFIPCYAMPSCPVSSPEHELTQALEPYLLTPCSRTTLNEENSLREMI